MKKQLYFLSLMLFMCTVSQVQRDFIVCTKGTKTLNGLFMGNNMMHKINDDQSNSYQIRVCPRMAWFIIDNLVVGAGAGIVFRRSSEDDGLGGTIQTTNTGFSIAPFARYYTNRGFFAELAPVVAYQTAKTLGLLSMKRNIFSFDGNAGIGYSIPLGINVSLESSFSYRREKMNVKDAPKLL